MLNHYALHLDSIQRVRYGFIDRTSNYQLNYENGESDKTLFPGHLKALCANNFY